MFTQRHLIKELEKRLEKQKDDPDKAECLRWKAERVLGLPGATPRVIEQLDDGRKLYSLNVGECRKLYSRLRGGPNA